MFFQDEFTKCDNVATYQQYGPGCHPQPSISRLHPWSTTSEDFFSTPSELVGDQCFRAMFFADKVPVYCKEKHISYRAEINTLITNELRAVATRMFDAEVFNRTQPEDQKVDALVGYDIVQFQMEISKAHKRYYSVYYATFWMLYIAQEH